MHARAVTNLQRVTVNGVEGAQRVCDHCYKEAEREAGERSSASRRSSDVAISVGTDRAPAAAPSVGAGIGGVGVRAAGGAAAGAAGDNAGEEGISAVTKIPPDLATKYTYFKETNAAASNAQVTNESNFRN